MKILCKVLHNLISNLLKLIKINNVIINQILKKNLNRKIKINNYKYNINNLNFRILKTLLKKIKKMHKIVIFKLIVVIIVMKKELIILIKIIIINHFNLHFNKIKNFNKKYLVNNKIYPLIIIIL